MKRIHAWTGRRLLASSLIAVGVVALGGTALAGHIGSGVKSYTGCLSSGGGVIVNVREGDAPKSACNSGQTQVHLSGGDITEISVTGGLTGGGTNGAVTIGLDPKFGLPQGCATGQVAKWQSATTSWGCAADNDTTYSAGTGLDLSGNAFSIEEGYRVKNTSDCSSGQFATGFGSDGVIQCTAPPAPPASSGIEVWHRVRPAIGAGTVVVLPENEGVDVITMTVPTGTFLVTAVVTLEGRGADEFSGSCLLRDGAFNLLPVHSQGLDITDGAIGNASGSVTIHGVVSFASAPNTIRFTCTSGADAGEASGGSITAVKVGTLHLP